MPDVLLAEIPLVRRKVLRVTRDGGSVHLRAWFTTSAGEMRPDRMGLTIEAADVEALASALGSLRTANS